MQLWKATTENSGHPFAKFATGSYETLMSQPKVLFHSDGLARAVWATLMLTTAPVRWLEA